MVHYLVVIITILELVRTSEELTGGYLTPECKSQGVARAEPNQIEELPLTIEFEEGDPEYNHNIYYALFRLEKNGNWVLVRKLQKPYITKEKDFRKFVIEKKEVTADLKSVKDSWGLLYKLAVNHDIVPNKYTPKDVGPFTAECFFYFGKPDGPTAKITHSDQDPIKIPNNREYALFGHQSKDITVDKNFTRCKDMTYQWTCVIQSDNGRDCDLPHTNSKASLILPEDVTIEGRLLKITLTVQSWNKETSAASVKVQVIHDMATLEITCVQNCPGLGKKARPERQLVLSTDCLKNCAGIESDYYGWTIVGHPEWSMSKNHGFVTIGPKFKSPRNGVFEHSQRYNVTVNLNDQRSPRTGHAWYQFETAPPPFYKCERISPQSGISDNTKFRLICQLSEDLKEATFEISGIKEGGKTKSIAKGQGDHLIDTTFTLAFGVKTVKVVVTKKNGDSLDYEFPVDVAEGLLELRTLVESALNGSNPANDTYIKDLKYKVIESVNKISFGDLNDVLDYTKMMNNLMAKNEDLATDPDLLESSSSACVTMANQSLELMKTEKHPAHLQNQSVDVARALAVCSERNGASPNPDAVKPVDLDITVVTAANVEGPTVEEHYGNYDSFDDKQYQNMDKLRKATSNIVRTNSMVAKNLALASPGGGPPVGIFGNRTSTLVVKDQGLKMMNINISVPGARLLTPWEFANSNHSYDILLTSWAYDLMWWNLQHVNVSTNVVNVEFWHSTCKERVSNFTTPVSLLLDLKTSSGDFNSFDDSAELVESYYPKFELNSKIKIYRVTLLKSQALRLQFDNMSGALDVVVTKYKFPTIEDFASSVTFDQNRTFMEFPNNEDYTIWAYVAILPRDVGNSSYRLLVQSASCVYWLEEHWEPACLVGRNGSPDLIHCECFAFSVIAGYIKPLELLPLTLLQVEVQLEQTPVYVVLTTVTSAWFLYCVVILIGFRSLKLTEKVYYLSDNSTRDLYMYLVSVKTGDAAGSGTTSNIAITLHGKKRQSRIHILNYPDPRMRLLQRNTRDIFVMTTHRYLGEMRQVELWLDSIGPNPSWFCDEIVIFDMQSRTEFYFKVNRLFCVIEGITYFSTKPSSKTFDTKWQLCNHYHSWFLHSHEENYCLIKRSSVVLSKVLSTAAVLVLLTGVPEFEMSDCMDLSNYRFGVLSFVDSLIASVAVFVVHVPVVLIFRFVNQYRHSMVQYGFNDDNPPMSSNYSSVCWVVLVTLTVLATTLLVVCGFWLPLNLSLVWLTSFGMSLVIDVLVLENLLIATCNFHMKLTSVNLVKRYNSIKESIVKQRTILHSQLGGFLLRPFFQHLYLPLTEEEIKDKRRLYYLRGVVTRELTDLVMFAVYNVILYVLMILYKDRFGILNQNEVISMMQGVHTDSIGFLDIGSVNDVYEYIDTTLIQVMQSPYWYGNYVNQDPGLMKDVHNKYLGTARLRQHRMKINICSVPLRLRFFNMTCWPEYSSHNAERQSLGYGWRKYNGSTNKFDRLGSSWNYTDASETGSLGYIGSIATYPGGGYLMYLGRTFHNSYANFRSLRQRSWIDQSTRGVFFEYLVYNVNTNIFSAVTMLYEQSATGFVFSSIDVQVAKLLFVQQEFMIVTLVVFSCFMVTVLVLIVRKTMGLATIVRTRSKSIWFLVDLFIGAMSLVCIFMTFVRMEMVRNYLNLLENVKHNEFTEYFNLFYFDELLNIFLALLVCIATIRLWQFLKFAMMFKLFDRILWLASTDLLTVTFVSFLSIMAFGFCGMLVFGTQYEEFNDFLSVFRTLFTLILKTDVEVLASETLTFVDQMYFCLYLFFVRISFSLFVTALVLARSLAMEEFSAIPRDVFTLEDYLGELFEDWLRCFSQLKRRLVGGLDNTSSCKVVPKPDEFRYANGVSISCTRMDILKFIVICQMTHLKMNRFNFKILTDFGGQILYSPRSGDEVFFKGRLAGHGLEIVDNRRLLRIETVVNKMLMIRTESKDVCFQRQEQQLDKWAKMLNALLGQVQNAEIEAL